MTTQGSCFFYLGGDERNDPSPVFRGFASGQLTEHGADQIYLDVDDIDRFCAFLAERGDHDVVDDIRDSAPDGNGYVPLHGAWATKVVTRDDIATLERLGDDARPQDDEDEGTDRQIDAQNFLFEVLEHLDPRTFADTSDFSLWCLKATPEEIIDEALRLIKEEPIQINPQSAASFERHQANPLAGPLLGLLNHVGGWDETDPNHPVVIARKAYEAETGYKL